MAASDSRASVSPDMPPWVLDHVAATGNGGRQKPHDDPRHDGCDATSHVVIVAEHSRCGSSCPSSWVLPLPIPVNARLYGHSQETAAYGFAVTGVSRHARIVTPAGPSR